MAPAACDLTASSFLSEPSTPSEEVVETAACLRLSSLVLPDPESGANDWRVSTRGAGDPSSRFVVSHAPFGRGDLALVAVPVWQEPGFRQRAAASQTRAISMKITAASFAACLRPGFCSDFDADAAATRPR